MAFEIISEQPITEFKPVSNAIFDKALEFLGELGCAEAGIMFLGEKYDPAKQKGLIRVNNKSLDKLRATLALVEQINNQKVIVRSIGASGTLKKAVGNYLAA